MTTDRMETKCADLHRYERQARAQQEAELRTAETKLKHVAYPCECLGYHVERIEPIPPTPNQRAIAELAAQCGHDNRVLAAVLLLRKQEMDKYKLAHVKKRRVAAQP